jgi:hypothetical protein
VYDDLNDYYFKKITYVVQSCLAFSHTTRKSLWPYAKSDLIIDEKIIFRQFQCLFGQGDQTIKDESNEYASQDFLISILTCNPTNPTDDFCLVPN